MATEGLLIHRVYKKSFKKSRIRRHWLSWRVRIVATITKPTEIYRKGHIWYFCVWRRIFFYCWVGGGVRGGRRRERGLTNERPWTGHVISGPMRGLEVNYIYIYTYMDIATTRLTGPEGPVWENPAHRKHWISGRMRIIAPIQQKIISYVMCHMSHVACHMSLVTCNLSLVINANSHGPSPCCVMDHLSAKQ